ncbi:MAG: hypothetical protein AB8B53_05110, partial [Flavobacteriales bacterium]
VLAQNPFSNRTSIHFEHYLESSLAVELSGNSEFDSLLQSSVKEIWPDKKADFFSTEEIREIKPQDGYCILGIIHIDNSESTWFSKSENYGKYYAVFIPPIGIGKNFLFEIIAQVPFSCFQNEEYSYSDFSECDYGNSIGFKIKAMLYTVKQTIDFVQEHERTTMTPFSFYKLYNYEMREERIEQMKQKLLLINFEDLNDKFTPELLDKHYLYNYEIVSEEEYKELVQEGSSNHIALIPAKASNSGFFIIDLEDYQLLGMSYGRVRVKPNQKITLIYYKQLKALQKSKEQN